MTQCSVQSSRTKSLGHSEEWRCVPHWPRHPASPSVEGQELVVAASVTSRPEAAESVDPLDAGDEDVREWGCDELPSSSNDPADASF